MKQQAAKAFIRTYVESGLLPEGSRLVVGGGGQSPRRFTICVSGVPVTLGVDRVEIGWFNSVAELVATVAVTVKLDVHDAVANANFYQGKYIEADQIIDKCTFCYVAAGGVV
jgi:hypothetical protein